MYKVYIGYGIIVWVTKSLIQPINAMQHSCMHSEIAQLLIYIMRNLWYMIFVYLINATDHGKW